MLSLVVTLSAHTGLVYVRWRACKAQTLVRWALNSYETSYELLESFRESWRALSSRSGARTCVPRDGLP